MEKVIRYYLGIPVFPYGDVEEGWQWAEWEDGRCFRHWADQLRPEPWG